MAPFYTDIGLVCAVQQGWGAGYNNDIIFEIAKTFIKIFDPRPLLKGERDWVRIADYFKFFTPNIKMIYFR